MLGDKDRALAVAIGKEIANHRKRQKLTQESIAEKMGLGLEAISRIERGVRLTSLSQLIQLSEILDCDVADLIGQATKRPGDAALKISGLISQLQPDDQELVFDVVEVMVNRIMKR